MSTTDPFDDLLARVQAGEQEASELLFVQVYGDLRVRAAAMLAGRGPATLQATALVHEAWLKLRSPGAHGQDRSHFMAIAAKAMRSVLVDAARAKQTRKREGRQVLLEEALEVYSRSVPDMSELHDELLLLADYDTRLAKIVELRFFGGMSIEEVAGHLGIGHATVERDWRAARAWLTARLDEPGAKNHGR